MIIKVKATLSKNVNILFRISNIIRLYLLKRNNILKIPIIINNFNRFSYLKQQIEWLENSGFTNIHIIDNLSSYPPLLDFYRKTRYHVYILDKNVGHEALWRTHVYQRFKHDFYVYTDPDIVPVNECPRNLLSYYMELLSKYPQYTKVGMGLKIDDLPDHYARKSEVLEWESQYWKNKIDEDIYLARTDTTFALYRPGAFFQQWDKTIRTGFPYIARHLPWYEDSKDLSEEEVFFKKSTTSISSWYKDEKYKG